MDATVIEVARFRRPPEPRADEPAAANGDDDGDDAFWLDEPTLILTGPPAQEAPEEAPEEPPEEMEPAPQVPLSSLFAEPPALPAKPAPAARAPVDRARRKRLLMLTCTVMAGAWVTLRPTRAPAPAHLSRVVAVRPADAQILPAQLPRLEAPARVDVVLAANALASARYTDALEQYQALAAQRPEQPVYALIARVLRSELEDRCARGDVERCQ